MQKLTSELKNYIYLGYCCLLSTRPTLDNPSKPLSIKRLSQVKLDVSDNDRKHQLNRGIEYFEDLVTRDIMEGGRVRKVNESINHRIRVQCTFENVEQMLELIQYMLHDVEYSMHLNSFKVCENGQIERGPFRLFTTNNQSDYLVYEGKMVPDFTDPVIIGTI